jgi:hypothetical protein
MSTAIPETERRSIHVDDDDVIHRWCCDEDVAICGEDLDEGEEVEDDEDGVPCPICETAQVEGWCCPVPGCRLRRFFHLGSWRTLR